MPSLGLGLSTSALPLLERLLLRGHIDQIKAVDQDIKAALDEHWTAQNVVLIVGAVGAVTRLIATRIQGKEQDPAVLVLDPKGTFVIPWEMEIQYG